MSSSNCPVVIDYVDMEEFQCAFDTEEFTPEWTALLTKLLSEGRFAAGKAVVKFAKHWRQKAGENFLSDEIRHGGSFINRNTMLVLGEQAQAWIHEYIASNLAGNSEQKLA